MSDISRVALFGKLNAVGYQAIESATVFCKLRGNPYVELEHWLAADAAAAGLRPAPRDPPCRARPVGRRERPHRRARPAAARRHVDFRSVEPIVENAVERGWVYATLMYGDHQVRTGHLLVAMLKSHSLRNALVGISRQFDRIDAERLADDLMTIVSGSPEDGQRATDGSCSGAAGRGERRHGARADGQAGGAEALRGRPHRARPARRDRSGARPRRRDPADRRHPDAPPAEQSDPDRRGRRRQDRGGRRLRRRGSPSATCRRRCATSRC